jgi:nitrite reductase/ring-hydroxylating ferredoxin subunit
MARVEVASSVEVREGSLHAARVGQRSLLLTRIQGKVHAIENRCPHLGLSLARGKLSDGTIRCPFHGSRFDICSGRNLDWVNSVGGLPLPEWSRKLVALGKQPQPLTVFQASEDKGTVYVEIP